MQEFLPSQVLWKLHAMQHGMYFFEESVVDLLHDAILLQHVMSGQSC